MHTFAISTPIIRPHDDLLDIIDQAIAADSRLRGKLPEGSVLAISSKIISYCQGRLVAKKHSEAQGASKETACAEKHALVAQEADLYLDPHSSKYNLMLTIKNSTLAVNAGIDESNANLDGEECFVLWPEQIQATLNQVWRHCRAKYHLQHFGVITTDSRTFPLRWGVVGTTLAYCGFRGLNNHIGQKDIFGREIRMEQVNVAEALGVAATLVMGEIAETTPLALLGELTKVQFVDHEPDAAELASNYINIADDVYAPLLEKATWHKGGGGVIMTQMIDKPKVILLAAISIDGFIAPADKEALPSTAWTSKEDRRFFAAKSKELGTMIMGSTTFETIKRALPERQTIIMTSQPARYGEYSDPSLTFTSEQPTQILARLARHSVQQVALCGGAHIYSLFLSENLVDEMYLTVEPYLFGQGIKLCNAPLDQSWKLVDQQKLNEQGTLVLNYERKTG